MGTFAMGGMPPLPPWLDALDLQVALQPVRRLQDGLVVGYEALLRARDEAGHWIPPRSLIERARADDAMAAVECRVLATALEIRARTFPDRLLFVNVDVDTLVQQPGLYARFLDGCPRCVLEVPESQATNLERALGWIRRWQVRVALDDFGMERSNLDRLLQLQPDYVKLDRHFVAGADRDPFRRQIIRGVVALARLTRTLLVAEGVERPGEHAFLRACGVPLAQGFLLGVPALGGLPRTVSLRPARVC